MDTSAHKEKIYKVKKEINQGKKCLKAAKIFLSTAFGVALLATILLFINIFVGLAVFVVAFFSLYLSFRYTNKSSKLSKACDDNLIQITEDLLDEIDELKAECTRRELGGSE